MRLRILPWLVLFALLNVIIGQEHHSEDTKNTNEEFHEELYVRPLATGYINSYFQFTTRWHYGDKNNLHNTNLIPRSIAETLIRFDVKELHIRLTQGVWRYESWGYPIVDAAPGAEAWAWFSAPNLTAAGVDEQWTRLASTFSGILCASLNFIDKTNTVEPKYSFRPQFAAGISRDIPKYVRYASLPREIVCTENLTPWKKLLPCNSKHGFASLLNSGYVHNTNYHSLGIKVRTICEKFAENCILEFTETFDFVYDAKILGNNDFSIRRLFGQGLNGHCALAKTSKIYVNLDDRYSLAPQPDFSVWSLRGGARTNYGVYDIKRIADNNLFNIAWVRNTNQSGIAMPHLPPLYAHRYILGRGQENGKIVTEISNDHYGPISIVLQENIPWYVPSYMHTLKVISSSDKQNFVEIQPKIVHFIPGVQRTRPYHLEIAFEIPAQSTVKVSFEFDYIFLKWLEYPPDANHGHYLGSAVITTQLPVGRNYTAIPLEGYLFADSFNASRLSYYLEVRTETIILSLPTPDFSMPYNVICLACTVVALAFGPIHSVATKRIVVERKDASSGTLAQRLINKVFRRKNQIDETHEEQEEDPIIDTPPTADVDALHEKNE
ncbi:GPI transamidase component PIG-T [Teleopsis dalmanni]|uniref:GPI transamidase component PIG-T n=1 Tax=Teleopsis dalmanni TaxID=139649 RepID=UPI0018CC8864|nr:GPI transamidase component PIG-T [Teleopsis dalmanni]